MGSSKRERSMTMEDDYTLMEALKIVKKMRKREKENESPRSPLTDFEWETDGDTASDETLTLTSGRSVSSNYDSKSEKLEENKISSNYDFDGFSEDECVEEAESEEELVLEDERDEVDYGLEFVVKEGPRPTITNPRRPKKIYKRNSKDSVLRDNRYPVAALAKLALAHYNAIRGTKYGYLGLVKAYKALADGFHFSIRFKAYLPAAQTTPINFQAMLFQGIPHRPTPGRKRRLSDVLVRCVYPLPNPPQEGLTITNPRRLKNIYKHCNSVLRNTQYPIAALARLALAHCNFIQGTNQNSANHGIQQPLELLRSLDGFF